MMQVTQPGGPETAETGPSTGEQAKEKVQETAQQVGQKAQEVKGQAGERVRGEIDARSTQAGEQVSSTADAIRRVGGQLREEGKDMPAKLADQAAERAERLGRYLTEADADRMLRDLESMARRRPWLAGLGGVVAGFLASRFVKASGSRRYEAQAGNGFAGGFPQAALPSGEGMPAMASVGEDAFVAETPSAPPASGKGGSRGRSKQ
jgi:gas vesicle protein